MTMYPVQTTRAIHDPGRSVTYWRQVMSLVLGVAMCLFSLHGCSSMKTLVYPCTEHAKCIKRCEKRYGGTAVEVACKDRCDRELGWELSRDKRPVREEQGKKGRLAK